MNYIMIVIQKKEVNDLRIELSTKNNYFAESRLEEVIELKEEQ